MSKFKIECVECGKLFEDDDDLQFFGIHNLPEIVKDHEDSFWGCPDCKTDEYLLDLGERE